MKKQFAIIAVIAFAAIIFIGNSASAQWNQGAGLIWTNDNVGIGLNNPQQKLDIDGNLSLGIAGSIFSKRQDNTMHEFFSMDSNNNIIINRSSVVDGLPSHVLMFIGEGRTFQVKSSTNQTLLRVNENDGRVGIGVSGNPGRKLEVAGDILIGSGGRLYVRRNDGVQHEMFSMDNNNDILVNRGSIVSGLPSNVYFGIGENRFFDVRSSSNNILLRVEEATGNLYLDGKITSTEIEVKLDVWPDFVFSEDYNLMSLVEVEEYITKNKSLPNVPSESEVIENGVELGQISSVLLQKVEELTLYMIQLSKENEELRQRISKLE